MLRIFLNLFLLLIAPVALGQAYYEHLTVEDGLSSNCVRSIFRDSKKRMWIGTENGIGIWENGEFTKLTQKLIGNTIWHIEEDYKNRIWFSNYGIGVSCWDNGKIKSYDKSSGLKFTTIRKIKAFNKNVYFGAENGLSVLLENGKILNWEFIKPKDKYYKYPFQVMDFIVIKDELYIATRDGDVKKVKIINNKIVIQPFIKKGAVPIISAYVENDWLYLSSEHIRRIRLNDFFKQDFSKFDTLGYRLVWEYTTLRGKTYGASWGVNTNQFGLYDVTGNYEKAIINDDHFGWCVEHTENELWYGTLENGIYIISPNDEAKSESVSYPWEKDTKLIHYFKHENTNAYLTKNGVTFFVNNKAYSISNKQFLEEYKKQYKKQFNIVSTNINVNDEFSIQFTKMLFLKNNWFVLTRIGVFMIDAKTFTIQKSMVDFQTTFIEFLDDEFIIDFEYDGVHKSNLDFDFKTFDYLKTKNNLSIPKAVIHSSKIGNNVFMLDKDRGLWKYNNHVFSPISVPFFKKGFFISKGESLSNGTIAVSTNDERVAVIEPFSGKTVWQMSMKQLGGKYIQDFTVYKNWIIIASESEIIACNGKQIKRTNRFQKPYQATLKNFQCYDGELSFLRNKDWITWDIASWLAEDLKTSAVYQLYYYEVGKEVSPLSIYEHELFGGQNLKRSYNQNSLVLKLRLWNEYKQNGFDLFYRVKRTNSWTPLSKNGVLELLSLAPDHYAIQFKIDSKTSNASVFTPPVFLTISFPWYQSWWFTSLLFFSFGTIIFFFVRQRFRRKAQQTKLTHEMEQKMVALKMEALQAQMNPHFIFNAMNAIQHFIIDQETDRAMFFLGEFSRLIRNVLDYTRIKTITLEEEFDFLKRYISIENMRFEGKIILDAPTIDRVSDILIPPLILQPIIENAILHGTETNHELRITVTVSQKENGVLLEIKNASSVQNKRSTHRSRGKEIIAERLGYYHPEAHVVFDEKEAVYRAKVWLPHRRFTKSNTYLH